MEVVMLGELCGRVRGELACLGELGVALVGALDVVERAGDGRGLEALADPAFALEVLTSAGPEMGPATIGRVLDFLRARSVDAPVQGGRPPVPVVGRPATLRAAVASWEAGPLALLSETTQPSYLTWSRRLIAAHGDAHPDDVTTGDLQEVIAGYVVKVRDRTGRSARGAERMAVSAYRHLWSYLVAKRWASENVAAALRKPAPSDPNRRPWRPEEAAMVRHLVRSTGRDPLLDEVIITLAERMGLRRVEVFRLRMRSVDLRRREAHVHGKGDKPRIIPIPPVAAELLERYVESRRPAHIAPERWATSEARFCRSAPNARYPEGRATSPRRVASIFDRIKKAAPDLFRDGDLVFHCYRHALGTFVEQRPGGGRAVTKAVLGHTGRKTSTDHYVYVSEEAKIANLVAYEAHVLAADPLHASPARDEASSPEAAQAA